MYDINRFVKKQLTEESLLEEVSEYEIYRYYIGDFVIGRPFNSPLAKDDNPSFTIFIPKKYPGKLFFKDFRGITGDAIVFVKEHFGLNYKEALERIAIDFNLEDKFLINTSFKQIKPVTLRLAKEDRLDLKKESLNLKITSRDWKIHDKTYWKSYGISKGTLELFNVVSIKYYWMYDKLYNADKYAYAYKEWKDNELNYKIYQPFRESNNHKFVNGFLDGTFSGWDLLPEYSNLIIITKSAKDCMFLYEHGYNAIAPQGEGYTFKPQVIDILKAKCKKLVLFYDNDEAGINSAKRNCEEFNLEYVTTNSKYKDITDYYKNNGLEKTINLLNKIFNYD